MKSKIVVLFTLFIALFGLAKVNAQNKDVFPGKWDVEVTGTPNGGDGHSVLTLERKDGKLLGTFKTSNGNEVKLSRVEEKKKEITAYFTSASGYDVYLYLKILTDNTAEGSMMDMFDAKAKRIVEKKQ